jgi:hypothetical protein
VGTIFEGPYDWTVRPVAEFVYEREFNTVEIYSVLAGAIWKVSDTLSFDVGFREAWVNRQPVTEIRAGLTFASSFQTEAMQRSSRSWAQWRDAPTGQPVASAPVTPQVGIVTPGPSIKLGLEAGGGWAHNSFEESNDVRPVCVCRQWRWEPPGELSIAPVADERLGWATIWVEAS